MGGMEIYSVKLSAQLQDFAAVERKVLPGHQDGSAPGLLPILLFGLSASIRIALRRSAFDVVHVADMASWPLAAVALARSRRTTVVLSAHGTDVAYPDRKGLMPYLYRTYMRLGARIVGNAKVVANSRATQAKVRGLGFGAVIVVPLATDMTPQAAPRAARNTRTGRRILFAGRLIKRKGCRWFVEEVLPLLPHDVTLDVAGTVWDANEGRALSTPRVRHLGRLDESALASAYANADCVVVPNINSGDSGFEGFGLVAVEAAAAGGLVLAAEHSGLKDAVLDGETGIKLPPGDAAAWAKAIKDVLAWPEETRNAFVANAAATASKHFGWDRVAKETFGAYEWEGSIYGHPSASASEHRFSR